MFFVQLFFHLFPIHHHALFAAVREKHGDGGDTDQGVDHAHDHWPHAKDGTDEVELEDADQTPVKRTDKDKNPSDFVNNAHAIEHHHRKNDKNELTWGV